MNAFAFIIYVTCATRVHINIPYGVWQHSVYVCFSLVFFFSFVSLSTTYLDAFVFQMLFAKKFIHTMAAPLNSKHLGTTTTMTTKVFPIHFTERIWNPVEHNRREPARRHSTYVCYPWIIAHHPARRRNGIRYLSFKLIYREKSHLRPGSDCC